MLTVGAIENRGNKKKANGVRWPLDGDGGCSVDVEHSVGTRCSSPIAHKFVAFVAIYDDAAAVQVVFTMARLAGGNAGGGHLEGFAANGHHVGVEAVGTLAVVGVEGEVAPCAVAHYQTLVHAEQNGAPLVDGVEYRFTALPLVAGELIVLRPALVLQRDGNENAAVGCHGRGECGVLMRIVVEHQIAVARTELVLSAVARKQEKDEKKRGKRRKEREERIALEME